MTRKVLRVGTSITTTDMVIVWKGWEPVTGSPPFYTMTNIKVGVVFQLHYNHYKTTNDQTRSYAAYYSGTCAITIQGGSCLAVALLFGNHVLHLDKYICLMGVRYH